MEGWKQKKEGGEKERFILKSWFTREHDMRLLFWVSLSAFPRYMQLQLSKTKLEVTLRTYCQKYACAKILSGGLAASACLERCKEKYIVLD